MAAESEDEAAMAYIREQWVGEQMTQRMDEFTVEQRVSVFAGTWNVNGKKAENAGASLAPWLFPWSAGAAAGVAPAFDDAAPRELPDVYALGFQARTESDVPRGAAGRKFLLGARVCAFGPSAEPA